MQNLGVSFYAVNFDQGGLNQTRARRMTSCLNSSSSLSPGKLFASSALRTLSPLLLQSRKSILATAGSKQTKKSKSWALTRSLTLMTRNPKHRSSMQLATKMKRLLILMTWKGTLAIISSLPTSS